MFLLISKKALPMEFKTYCVPSQATPQCLPPCQHHKESDFTVPCERPCACASCPHTLCTMQLQSVVLHIIN